jgi:hypothetical protein
MTPLAPGYSIRIKDASITDYACPTGVWASHGH